MLVYLLSYSEYEGALDTLARNTMHATKTEKIFIVMLKFMFVKSYDLKKIKNSG